MNTRKFLLAGLAGFVGNVVVFILVEQMLLGSYMTANVWGPIGADTSSSSLLPIVAVLSWALVMAYLYPKGYEGGAPATEGLRFGILLGIFLVGAPFAFFVGTFFSLGTGPILALALANSLKLIVSGLLIGLVYGKM